MNELKLYMKKLYAITGGKLIVNVICMVVISILEGVGIYMLVPMLAAIGILGTGFGGSLPLEWLKSLLQYIPQDSQLAVVLIIFVSIIASQALLQRNQTILSSQIQQHFVHTLRYETYQLLLQSKWELFMSKRKSDFSHILTSELARVSQGTTLLLRLTSASIFTLIQIGFAFWLSPKLTLLVLGSAALLFFLLRPFVHKAKKLGDHTSDLSQQYMSEIVEHFNGMKDIKSNGLEKQHVQGFRALCLRMEQNMVDFIKLNSATQLIYQISAVIIIALFVYSSIHLFASQGESLLLLIVIFTRLWPRFSMIQTSIEYIVSMIPAFRSLMQLQRECEGARENKDFTENESDYSDRMPILLKHGIRYGQLSYRYPGQKKDALHGINAFIPVNGMTAVVGRSGAGKSTFIDLLMGLIEPTEGEILLDHAPLHEEQRMSWRQSISYVSQDPFLFHSSIRDNLLLVRPGATEEELWESLEFAAAGFVKKLPQGLDTVIGDRGVRLSGGERQRIVLARAILRNPSVLILDEATSALDSQNELHIQDALDALKGSMTIIVIAHRLSTIRNADQVIVLEEGRVMQQGEYEGLASDEEGAFGQLLSYQTKAT
ncbi:ABC transporter ATP-binding protein [Paenibacillus sp. Marseille-Q4541]|uniref:ABC transporter ATP-binding protein n=1 Tax=Paenibacillus sp. Marseille-Q4541 TaxID=2831522 RepID=UPI001BA83094|nr:ABC transporter ATP-binding protein [Paenibacillus sp. Marseille-Q4541]